VTSDSSDRAPPRTLLALRLGVAGLALAAAAGGAAFLRAQSASFLHQAEREVDAVAELQSSQVEAWRQARLDEAAMVHHAVTLVAPLANPSAPGAMEAAGAMLREIQAQGYSAASLVDPAGLTVAGDAAGAEAGPAVRRLVASALETGRPAWSELAFEGDSLALRLAVPLRPRGSDRQPVGVLLLTVDPRRHLFPILESWPTQRRTAEVLLVRRDGDEVVFLSGLRRRDAARTAERRPLSAAELPAVKAVSGALGPGSGTDYRGAEVIYAARPVEGSTWFVVAKIEEQEVLSPVRSLAWLWLAVGLALVGGALLVTVQWWQLRSAGLERARRSAETERDALAARFHGFAEAANDLVLLIDEAGHILEANGRAAEAYGYTREALCRLTVVDLRAPGTEGAAATQMAQVASQGGLRFETSHRRRDGSTFAVEVSSRVLEVGGRRLFQSIVRDVSERRAIEAALRVSEENLSITLDSIGDAVIATDAAARVTRMNPVAERLTGWTLADARGRELLEVFHIVNEASRARVESPADRVLREGVVAGLANHTLLISRDGREVPIADSGAPIRARDGAIIGVVLVFRDVTEQHAAERASAYQQAVLATVQDAIVGLDAGHRVTSWSGAAQRVYGYTDHEALGQPFDELVRPERAPGAEPAGTPPQAPLDQPRRARHRRKDGTLITVESVVGALRDPEGRVLGHVGAHRDVSARVRAEEAASQSEAKFRTAFHQAGFGVLLVARDGRIVDHNQAMRDLLGFTGEELSALRVQELNQAADAERSRRFLDGLFAGELDGYTDERQYRRKDGATLDVLLRVSPVPDPAGGVAHALGIVEDITARRLMERKLLSTERMASMGMLAAGVAHEINNPLSFVLANLGYALESARSGRGSSAEVARALEEAIEGANRVRSIVRDVKTFSREHAEDGGPCDLAQVLQATANVAQNEIRHRARLVLDVAALPPIAGSAHRIGQVLLNLLLNAAQAIPPGRAGENEIRVSASVDGPLVAVEVRDTGSGIAPEVRDRLFQPFATTKPDGQGTGLGLFISRELVRSLGGEIEVQSQPGAGTAFTVRLPWAKPARDVAPASAPAGPRRSARARILVVDDDPLVARALQRLLASRHEVLVETSASAALARAAGDSRFDLVFCDLMMPDMTGMELHGVLRERHPELAARIIFMTGGAFTPEARQFLEQVPNPKVEKPFEHEAVLALVEACHQRFLGSKEVPQVSG